ncbi:MAG: 50S ribosomal protein L20 [Planctomycetes bacterium]|nr:50S ribosomal protein L20 [Planctomycetota bacterium]
MTHAVSRVPRHARKKKFRKQAKGYWGRRQNYRQARGAVERGWRYSWFHRRKKKREFRRLWITRLSAAARSNGLTYSSLVHQLGKAKIELNRKSLSELAIRDPQAFAKVVQQAQAAK